MPRSRRNNHRRSITSVSSTTQLQPHRPPPEDHAPLPQQPIPDALVQPQQPLPTAQQGFSALGPHPVSPRGGFGGRGRGGGDRNGWGGGGGHQNNTTNTGSLGWTTTETGSGNGGGQNNKTGSSGWTKSDTGGGGFPGTQRAGGAPVEGGDVHMGSSNPDGSGVGVSWGSNGSGNGGSNDNGGNYHHGHNNGNNNGHSNDYRGGRGQCGGRGEWWGDRGGRGGRGGLGGRGDWGIRGDRGGRGDWGGRGNRGRGGRGGRGAWGGQGDTHGAPNTHSSSGWGETGSTSTNQTGQGQGTETHATQNTDASSVWGGTGTNAIGIGNNSTESRGNDGDANGGWGVNNNVPQAVWTSTEMERNKRPPDQSAGNAAKKLKCYVLHELEQVRRRVEEWEARWDEEREGEGVVERAVEGGGLVEKMVWQSEATFLVVWPVWLWGAVAAGLGEVGGQQSRMDGGFSWAKSIPGQRMLRSEGVVEPE